MKLPYAFTFSRRFLIYLGVCFLLISAAFLISSVNGEEKKIIDKGVFTQLEIEQDVEVFITFTDKPINLASSVKKTADEQKKEVLDMLDKKVRYDFGNVIAANISADDIVLLAQQPGVKNIALVGIRNIFLQDSVPLINGTITYPLQTQTFNLTGTNEGICILDTGINYTHASLGGCYGNNSASSGCKVLGGHDFVNSDADPYDDHGHGTHIAGIAAANGTIRGVAPDARLFSIKVCNSAGSCSDSNIIAGINWCMGNSSAYNISVISMSFGSSLYSNYCNTDPLAASINTAVGSNISVVIATGNDGSTTQIASPACVQNATRVGSIRKDDATFDYNRNSLLLLVAPGFSINSTCIISDSATGYCTKSGTSMATPHISGAIAILRQFLRLNGQSRTPIQLELTLNSTGKRTADSGSGLNFSRINLYAAVIGLDGNSPNVTLVSPSNASFVFSGNQTFVCNATDLALRNATFYLWNSSSGTVNQSQQSFSGAAQRFEVNVSNISVGSYDWNCLYTDENNNATFASSNFTLTATSLLVNLISPSNSLFTKQNQTFSCNATTSTNALTNATFYIWNSTNATVNTSFVNVSGSSNSTNFSFNFTYADNYRWNCLFMHNGSAQVFAINNFSLTYDITSPTLNISSPLANQTLNAGRFNVTLNENGSCQYSLTGGTLNASLSSTDNKTFNATNTTLAQDSWYNVTYYCNDSSGNSNNSVSIPFSIDLTNPNVSITGASPADGHSETSSLATLTFYYNASDNLNISSCSLLIGGSMNLTNSSITNQSAVHSFAQSFSPASYTWNINCTDSAGNIGNTSSRSFTISAPVSQISGGGGGGGGGGSAAPANPAVSAGAGNTSSKGIPQTSGESSTSLSPPETQSEPGTSPLEKEKKGFFKTFEENIIKIGTATKRAITKKSVLLIIIGVICLGIIILSNIFHLWKNKKFNK